MIYLPQILSQMGFSDVIYHVIDVVNAEPNNYTPYKITHKERQIIQN